MTSAPLPLVASTDKDPGIPESTGLVVSTTVIVNGGLVALFPLESCAVQVTGVDPSANELPGAGVQTTLGDASPLSVAVGGV